MVPDWRPISHRASRCLDALALTLQRGMLGSEFDQRVGLLLPGRHEPITHPTLFPCERQPLINNALSSSMLF